MQKTYGEMWRNAAPNIRHGRADVDPLIDSVDDFRRGLTLILRPDRSVLNSFSSFLKDAKAMEREQYFYAPQEIHSTVISIITCVSGFELNQICVPDYVEVIEKSLESIREFEIQYSGITASSNCVMARGFPSGSGLDDLRSMLRRNFANSGLQCSIDQRYSISTAHSTLVRFRTDLYRADDFVSFLERNRQTNFGKSTVSEMHLVFNDWYHRKSTISDLHTFNLIPAD